jgi:hypothetical protein
MATVIEKPWYRHFWFWFVAAPPILTVIASFITLFLAGSTPALVVDDFGQIAMAIEKDQQRDHKATELGVGAALQFDPRVQDGRQTVALTVTGSNAAELRLDLIHPTREDLDRHVVLKRVGDRYAGSIERMPGRLYLQVTDDADGWRLTGALAPEQQAVSLTAAARR